MKLSDLIIAVGDENVSFQMLDSDAIKIDASLKETRITFAAPPQSLAEMVPDGRTKDMGLVIWLPRDKVKAALEQQS
ncbi:hypothetical protein [Cupriavidus basilensis]